VGEAKRSEHLGEHEEREHGREDDFPPYIQTLNRGVKRFFGGRNYRNDQH
jgi:hypothetical protein